MRGRAADEAIARRAGSPADEGLGVGGLACYLRGRDVSQHAWIPSLLTPYVGAGVGLMRYRFTQHGDFVDINDLSVFSHTYNSQGWSPSAHVFGGVDVKAWKRLYFSGEARYLWSHTDLGSDSDFPKFTIDLAGLRATGGIRYMF